jgi:hypothetical protein
VAAAGGCRACGGWGSAAGRAAASSWWEHLHSRRTPELPHDLAVFIPPSVCADLLPQTAPMVAANGPAPGWLASVYSEVQTNQVLHTLPLPSVLRSNFLDVDGPASSVASNPGK